MPPFDQTKPPETGAAAPCRLLLAEDHEASARYAQAVLTSCGCAVRRADDGVQALAALQEEDFDIVFLDVHMPRMEGLTALHAIRAMERQQQRARLPVVIVTASAFPREVQQCMDAGADDVITKPFKVEELHRALARWTGSTRELDPHKLG